MISRQEIINARYKSVPAAALRPEDRTDALDGLVKRVYAMKGYMVDAATQPEIDMAVAELDRKLQTRWTGVTLGEVWLALESGITGDLGKETRPTTANYIMWMKAYLELEQRGEALKALEVMRRNAEAVKQIAPEDERKMVERRLEQKARELWEEYKSCGKLKILTDGFAAALYDFLVSRGKLKAKEETIAEARRRAARRPGNGPYAKAGIEGAAMAFDFATKRELVAMYYDHLLRNGKELKL